MTELISNPYIVFAIGLILGLILAQFFKTKKTSSTLSKNNSSEFEKELLDDQVKQLEAKIKTLEKALELK